MNAWKPIEGQIMTKWADEIDQANPHCHTEYPRPQMKREKWESLNGLWEYAITNDFAKIPNQYEGQILVPFAIESSLSGVKKAFKPNETLWYFREFSVPHNWQGNHILINFGAVDWHCEVYINRQKVGFHKGGFDAFTFDITDFLSIESKNTIHVAVQDPTNKGAQARGKQILKPWAAFYTAVSGIWQTVWLEPVSNEYINHLTITPHYDEQTVEIQVFESNSTSEIRLMCEICEGRSVKISKDGIPNSPMKIKLTNMKSWSPDHPFLYDLKISLKNGPDVLDTIESYFGMRKIEIKNDENKIPRIFLNNHQIFQYGVLDQGYFPDGLFTAPNENAMRYDIDYEKEIGFNMIRKHVKVEPAIWYHHCDKIGMLVWQDMPYGGNLVRGSLSQMLFKGKKLWVTKEYKKNQIVINQFEHELKRMVESLYNHPSVITWVLFNEGWGQHRTVELTDKIREWDNTRLINSASGWVDMKVGDMRDIHKYPGPKIPDIEQDRVAVNGEFGGLGQLIPDHSWVGTRYWAYKTYKTKDELRDHYAMLIDEVVQLKKMGLTTAIYTQITDVEQEINGFLTYDRKVKKYDANFLQQKNSSLFSH
jgi:beta-galactosidase/beta-glucuronidase